MSTSELEGLGLDAAVITKLQAIIGSDQLDNDAITEKVAELYGGKPSTCQCNVYFLKGNRVEVKSCKDKEFKGKWDRDIEAGPSEGKLFQHRPLKGRYAIAVTLTQKTTIIVFRKLFRTDPKPSGEADEPEEPEDYDEEQQRPPVPDAVFRGKGIVNTFVGGAGHGRWIVHI